MFNTTDINYMIMQEIGLDVDCLQRILDQDTNNVLQFNEKILKYSLNIPIENIEIGRGELLFNPKEDIKQLQFLFNHFVCKLSSMEEREFTAFCPVSSPSKDGKMAMEIRGPEGIISSRYYYNPALAYVDLMSRLNDPSENANLLALDSKLER